MANAKLREMREEVASKRKALHSLYQEAGGVDELDLSKITSIDGTDSQKLDELRKRNEELNRLQDKATAYAEQVEAAKKLALDEAEQEAKAKEAQAREGAPAQTLGKALVESASFKHWRANGAPQKSELGGVTLKDTFARNDGWEPESLRIPGFVVPFAYQEPMLLDVIPTAMTTSAVVKYMEHDTWSNAAAERAEEAAYAEDDMSLVERSVTVENFGVYVAVTDEQLDDVAMVETWLSDQLRIGMRRRISSQMLSGTGASNQIRGLLNVTGRLSGTTYNEAASNDTPYETAFRCLTGIQTEAFGAGDLFVLHPTNWQKIRLAKASTGTFLFGNPDTVGVTAMWGVPRVLTTEIAANTMLTIDRTWIRFFERLGIEVEVGYSGTDFLNGRRSIRAKARGALVAARPKAIVQSTLR